MKKNSIKKASSPIKKQDLPKTSKGGAAAPVASGDNLDDYVAAIESALNDAVSKYTQKAEMVVGNHAKNIKDAKDCKDFPDIHAAKIEKDDKDTEDKKEQKDNKTHEDKNTADEKRRTDNKPKIDKDTNDQSKSKKMGIEALTKGGATNDDVIEGLIKALNNMRKNKK